VIKEQEEEINHVVRLLYKCSFPDQLCSKGKISYINYSFIQSEKFCWKTYHCS